MNKLFAFYDGACGLCGACRSWLGAQPQWVEIAFLPYQSEEARLLCPVLDALKPDEKIVVMADTGELYQGESAWLILLWATKAHRQLSATLASPGLRHLAGYFVEAISTNRLSISRLLRRYGMAQK